MSYREIRLRRDAGENRTPEYLRISPCGTVPAITDDETGAGVFESTAILIYLAEKAKRFLPEAQPARADVFKWLIFETANIGPVCGNIYEMCFLDAKFVAGSLEFQRQKLRAVAALLDARLAQQEYLAGECSIADFALLPWVVMLEDFADIALSHFPHIERWAKTMQQRPAVQTALGFQRTSRDTVI